MDENSYELFINCLSKKKDFILPLSDKDFELMIINSKDINDIFIEIEMRINDISEILL